MAQSDDADVKCENKSQEKKQGDRDPIKTDLPTAAIAEIVAYDQTPIPRQCQDVLKHEHSSRRKWIDLTLDY